LPPPRTNLRFKLMSLFSDPVNVATPSSFLTQGRIGVWWEGVNGWIVSRTGQGSVPDAFAYFFRFFLRALSAILFLVLRLSRSTPLPGIGLAFCAP
jgi:hypothetical protein